MANLTKGRTSKGLGGKVDHRTGMDSAGYYIRTFSARKLYFDRVEDHDYSITDIAHALAARVRWTGHVRRIKGKFISIGQHCCIVHDIVAKMPGATPSRCKQALIHDGAEALSLIHISEPTRQAEISYAVFCLK